MKHLSLLAGSMSRLEIGHLIASTEFSDLPPRYRDDARKTAATGEELAGFLDEFGGANRSEVEAGTLRSLRAKREAPWSGR